MGPYLAVIKDSFREALASRVLWVLLVVISLLLIALGPFGYSESATTHIGDGDIQNFGDFVQRIQASGEIEDKSPSRRIWERLTEKQRKDLDRFKPGKNPDGFDMVRIANRFVGQLNEMIDSEDFYDSSYWVNSRIVSSEGRDIAKRRDEGKSLSSIEIGRMNRLALEAGFPDIIKTGFPTSLQFRYAAYELGPTFPISRTDFDQLVTSRAAIVMKWFVGIVGVIIAILITSSIIPQMFDPGSLHLLLSFPVSRSLLFLSKYLGGCAFTFLSAAYLVGGLWLLLGVRFGIWHLNLLYCIPLYVFVFAIYYAVSALAGVIWRNSLISIVLAVLFWLACLTVGMVKGTYEQFALESTRFTKLLKSGDTVVGVNKSGLSKRWDPEKKKWDEVFFSDSQRALQMVVAFMPEVPAEFKPMGPVFDTKNDRLVSVIRDMQAGGTMVTLVGESEKDFDPKEGAPPPSGMIELLADGEGNIFAVSSYGLYLATADIDKKPKDGGKLFNMIPLPNVSKGPFEKIGPDPAIVLSRPYSATIDRSRNEIVLYSRTKVTVLAKGEDGKYRKRVEGEIDAPSGKNVQLAATGGNILIGRPDGTLLIYDDALDLKKEIKPEARGVAEFVSASPDGETFAVTFNNGRLWLVDATTQEATLASVAGQGSISATLFTGDNQLMVTRQSVRVTEYDLKSGKQLNSYSPAMDMMETGYRYGIYPLYIIFPKPSELNRTIDYTLADEESANKIEKPFQPVWSSAAFIIGVLIICCFFIEWQEF